MKLLLADDDATRARALAGLLAGDPGLTVIRLPADVALADAVARHAPDVILVDMARPDRDALEGVRQVTARDPRPVVLFVDEDDPDFMEEAIGAGVCSYNVLGLPPPDVKPILRAAVALFRRHREAQDALARSERALAGRDAVAGAKALLMRERRMSEPQAHRWLQRQAMARGAKLAEIAAALLRAPQARAEDRDRDPGGPAA